MKIKAGPNTAVIDEKAKSPTFEWYKNTYPFQTENGYAILYKAVRKTEDGTYHSDRDRSFIYEIGKPKIHKCNQSVEESCTYGLHISHLFWAVRFGRGWANMAILECKVPIDKIVVAKDCDGKIRTSELEVIREVPESEYL